MEAALRQELGRSYRRGIRKGLFKIMSKMGISTIASYPQRAASSKSSACATNRRHVFRGLDSRIQGADFATSSRCRTIWRSARGIRPRMSSRRLLKYMHNGEYHMYNPDVIATLQSAVMTGDYPQYLEFAALVNAAAGVLHPRSSAIESRAAAIPIEESNRSPPFSRASTARECRWARCLPRRTRRWPSP